MMDDNDVQSQERFRDHGAGDLSVNNTSSMFLNCLFYAFVLLLELDCNIFSVMY